MNEKFSVGPWTATEIAADVAKELISSNEYRLISFHREDFTFKDVEEWREVLVMRIAKAIMNYRLTREKAIGGSGFVASNGTEIDLPEKDVEKIKGLLAEASLELIKIAEDYQRVAEQMSFKQEVRGRVFDNVHDLKLARRFIEDGITRLNKVLGVGGKYE